MQSSTTGSSVRLSGVLPTNERLRCTSYWHLAQELEVDRLSTRSMLMVVAVVAPQYVRRERGGSGTKYFLRRLDLAPSCTAGLQARDG
jgi:hypothetical protein